VIREQVNQQQDVATLSRDTAHANGNFRQGERAAAPADRTDD